MKKKVAKVILITEGMTKKKAIQAVKDLSEGKSILVPSQRQPESRFDLYKRLKEAGYPQGGGGQYMGDPDSNVKVYIPTYQELLTHYVADPKDWELMVDAITKVWINNKNGNTKTKESS